MTWRTVVIENKAKLSYKNGYLIVRNEEIKMIHISEISTVLIDSTAVSITSYLISELMKKKIKIIFCDDKRNPQGEVISYYGSHDSSKAIGKQLFWEDFKVNVWTEIIKEKIKNQAKLLNYFEVKSYTKLIEYANQVELNDVTNREGHAAKVYFNLLFGKIFTRESNNDTNAALNYGYSILLSQFNKEIVSCGYLTQIGIKHSNYFNQFNLSSDLMEPFRPLVDKIVRENYGNTFNSDMKHKLLELLTIKVKIKGKDQYVSNAIGIYVKSVFAAIENKDLSLLNFIEYEL